MRITTDAPAVLLPHSNIIFGVRMGPNTLCFCPLTGSSRRRTGHLLRRFVSSGQAASQGESSTPPFILFLTRDQNHAHCIASQSPIAVGEQWHHRGKSTHSALIPPTSPYTPMSIARSASGASSSHSVAPPLLPASSQHSASLLDRVSSDLIPFAPYLHGIFKFYRHSGKSDIQPVRTVHATDCRTPALIRIDGRGLV
jgi:hypothetical protein